MAVTDSEGSRASPPPGPRDHIIATTLDLIAANGLKHVSMARIAAEVGVTTPALYHHFPDKRALMDLAVDQIVRSIPLAAKEVPWQERLRALLQDQERVFRSFPGSFLYLIEHPTAPARLRFMEIRLRVLDEGGFRGLSLARAFATIAFFHSPQVLVDDGRQTDLDAAFRAANRSAASGPTLDEFPHVKKHLSLMLSLSYDDHFELGLDELIRSLALERETQ